MTQLYEYNQDSHLEYTRPTLDLYWQHKYWGYLTKGMSQEELADFEKAKDTLENYEKVYTIVEYASKINEGMTVLQRKIMSNNPTIPMNFYRSCRANQPDILFKEMEAYL